MDKNTFTELRRRAQGLVSGAANSASALIPEDIETLVHELETYQVELELQNEELRQAQRALEQSHQRYTDLYDFAPVGYLTISEKSLIVEANLTVCELLGVNKTELTGQPFTAFIQPEDQDIYYQHRRKLLDSRIKQTCELRVHRQDNSLLDVQLESDITEDIDGVLGQFRLCLTDISKRKKLEETLLQNTEWGKTFDAMQDVITIQDKNLRIVRANKAAHQLFQFNYGDLKGRYCYELFTKRQKPCSRCPLCKTLKDKKNHFEIVENKILNKIFQVSSSFITDDKGELQYLVHVAKDITEQKKLEEELFQAKKMEAIGTLAGGIAHDFNNILFAIIGYAEFARQEVPLESSTGKNLEQVIASANRAADLVKQILAFSHKTRHIKHTVPPHPIIKEALNMLKATLPESISIEEDIYPACGMVLVDPTSLHQIVVNLCTNAMHAMADMKGTLCVGLHRRELSAAETEGKGSLSPGPFAVLSVRDTGRGIDPTTIDRIFEPYFSTKELGRGTGLGLAIVQSAVRDCGGFIEVESSVGEGSVFSVYLPVSEESSVQTDISAQKGGIAALAARKRILVVDDEMILVKINEQRLKNQGYHVTALSDSKEALDIFRRQPESFDLLITDQTMPKLNGMELVRAVQKIKPSIPVIMLTGHSTASLEEEAKALGIKRYLAKPVSDVKLLITVQEALNATENIE